MYTYSSPIKLTNRVRAHWSWLLPVAFTGSLAYFLMSVYRADGNLISFFRGRNSIRNLELFLFYYIPFECISIAIFILLVKWYHNVFAIRVVQPNVASLFRYQLLMLPLVAGSIFVFGPITNTIRYVIISCPDCSWQHYFPEFFMTSRMYFNYLLPILITGYAIVNVDLFASYEEYQQQQFNAQLDKLAHQPVAVVPLPDAKTERVYLDAFDENGQTRLCLRDVYYVEVESKSYLAYTRGQTYRIRFNLAELEAELPAWQFYRINRSVMINLAHVRNYSFWENDKYIVRLTDTKTEFVMQRARLTEFKKRLDAYNFTSSVDQGVTEPMGHPVGQSSTGN